MKVISDDDRWRAVANRDPDADGEFVYSVRTTGVYCRPTCPSRRALRKNVAFHDTFRDAEAAGYRPCRRCRPTEPSLMERQARIIADACRILETSDKPPTLARLAVAVGMSGHHLHRLFKSRVGITPREYAAARRLDRARRELNSRGTVTEAIHGAGFQSNSRFYETSNDALGMTPTAFRSGGIGMEIRFAVGETSLGAILVAATEKGICAILLGDDPDELARNLQDQFPMARLIGGDAAFEKLVAVAVGLVETPSADPRLPLDIRGTAFQRRAWEALRAIPAGNTATYGEIAERIGRPGSARAVANACAANRLAVAIPCHRVVRTDGSPSGYRWGVERKVELLRREGNPPASPRKRSPRET